MSNTKAIDKLEDNFDEIIEMIIEGKRYREIKDKYGVSLAALHAFLSKDEHCARTREALNISADTYVDKAEQILTSLKRNSNMSEIMKARELAQFYKWLAAKRRPKEYSERQQIEHELPKGFEPPPPLAFKVAAGVTIPTQESQNNEPTGN